MPLLDSALPFSSAFDPAEDSPGSIDPLGTLTHAERFADLLFPGMTARMGRLRLLTVAAVAAHLADQKVRLSGREELRMETRLGFERLLVSALVRIEEYSEGGARYAARGIPGRLLAKSALSAGEPLGPTNFLKGPAANGPVGVVLRLARHVGVLDLENRPGPHSPRLLLDWAEDRGLGGLLLDEGDGEGVDWCRHVLKHCSGEKAWPGPGAGIWERLGSQLRADQPGPRERRCLRQFLDGDPFRKRMFELLREPACISLFKSLGEADRGELEFRVLNDGVARELGDTEIDRRIALILDVVRAYERVAGLAQQVFDAVRWALTRQDGQSGPDEMRSSIRTRVEKAHRLMRGALTQLTAQRERLESARDLAAPALTEPLRTLEDDLASPSSDELLDRVLLRHAKVQKQKQKACWIDQGKFWVLVPGRGIGVPEPPTYSDVYLHPYRIHNAYSFLADLDDVGRGATFDAEA